MWAESGFPLGIADAVGEDAGGEDGGGEDAGEPLVDREGCGEDAEGPPEETDVQDARATSNAVIVTGHSGRGEKRTATQARYQGYRPRHRRGACIVAEFLLTTLDRQMGR